MCHPSRHFKPLFVRDPFDHLQREHASPFKLIDDSFFVVHGVHQLFKQVILEVNLFMSGTRQICVSRRQASFNAPTSLEIAKFRLNTTHYANCFFPTKSLTASTQTDPKPRVALPETQSNKLINSEQAPPTSTWWSDTDWPARNPRFIASDQGHHVRGPDPIQSTG